MGDRHAQQTAHNLVMLNCIAFTGWATMTVAGVIEAQWRFKPKRAPRWGPAPSLVAAPALLPSGSALVAQGSF